MCMMERGLQKKSRLKYSEGLFLERGIFEFIKLFWGILAFGDRRIQQTVLCHQELPFQSNLQSHTIKNH